MGWFGRGIGDFGSQVGEGYDINLGWKERLQNLAMRNAQQKLADLKGPLELQELQTRLRQMKNPQAAGIVKGPGGETSGVTFDPETSTYSIKTLTPGATVEPKFPTLQAAAAYYLQKGDFEKLKLVNDEIDRNKQPAKSTEPKAETQIFGGYRWQLDPDKKIQGQRDKTGQWVRLGLAKEAGSGGEENTPFKLWMQTTSPKDRTFPNWMQSSKQLDRTDATKAVTTVMNAQKSLQSLEAGIQKSNKTFSIWNPRTWGTDPAMTALSQQAVGDYEAKRQDAVEKLTDAGMPVPAWLTQPIGETQEAPPPNVSPPTGFVVNKTH
jgi:hypothetical protein